MPDSRSVEQLQISLQRLPGVGPKSAQRMAFHLLERDREGAYSIADAIKAALSKVNHCQRCNNFSENTLCSICASRRRDSAILCIAETPADVEAIEQASAYKGMYFILMGHLSPLDGIGPEQLGITRVLDLIRTETIDEVILATNLTLEGEATADYIADLLHEQSVSVTRLARGVPVGGELEYMDAGTLNQAFSDRRKI
jgi:recombination protein RecR